MQSCRTSGILKCRWCSIGWHCWACHLHSSCSCRRPSASTVHQRANCPGKYGLSDDPASPLPWWAPGSTELQCCCNCSAFSLISLKLCSCKPLYNLVMSSPHDAVCLCFFLQQPVQGSSWFNCCSIASKCNNLQGSDPT